MLKEGFAVLCLFKKTEFIPSTFSFLEFLLRLNWPFFRPAATLI
jgi:hypothetical protein